MPEHGHRAHPGQVYSAIQLSEILAIPCVYLLTGKAQAVFPQTHRGAPSAWVNVIRNGLLTSIPAYPNFAVTVNWRQWEEVVVPVLEDPRWDPNNPLWLGDLLRLLELLELALRLSGEAAGYGDPGDILEC